MGVVSSRWVLVESMGVATGVIVRRYIDFFILLIPTPLVSAIFCSSIPTFCSFLCFSFLFQYLFVIYVKKISRSINTYKGVSRQPCFIREETHTNERFVSCDGHQLYAFKGRGGVQISK